VPFFRKSCITGKKFYSDDDSYALFYYSAVEILRNYHFMFRNQFNVSSKKILERSLQFSIIVVKQNKKYYYWFFLVHRHFILVCYVSGMKCIGIKRIAALLIGLKHIGN